MNLLVLLVPLVVLAVFTAGAVVVIRAVFSGAERLIDKANQYAADNSDFDDDERPRRKRRKKPKREKRDAVMEAIEADTRRHWKCPHCGKRNHAEALECRGCGADPDVEIDDVEEADDWLEEN